MGSNTFDWNSPQFQNASYFKWNTEGDTIEGVIVGMSTTTFPAKGVPGDPDYQAPSTYPVLAIDTALGERELTVSNVDLLDKTRAKNAQVGDWYSAAWVATAGKKRIFLVVVKKEPSTTTTGHPTIGAGTSQIQAIDADAAKSRAIAQSEQVPF